MKPDYFIDDIKTLVENKLPSSIVEEFNIGSIEGNFIAGFKVNDVSCYDDGMIVFSEKSDCCKRTAS